MLKDPFTEEQKEAIRKKNEIILEEFQSYLENRSLAEQSIEKHVYNITYFLNEYLLYRDKRPEEVVLEIDNFMGKWFIKKTPWITVSSIQLMISSLKQFYRFLLFQEKISKKELETMLNKIKRSQNDWINRFRSTNY